MTLFDLMREMGLILSGSDVVAGKAVWRGKVLEVLDGMAAEQSVRADISLRVLLQNGDSEAANGEDDSPAASIAATTSSRVS